MLNLEELFKKRPFIYYINNVYYTFGNGVCSLCNEDGEYVTLPIRYDKYVEALVKKDISQEEAWEVYRRLVFIAESIKENKEHTNLKNQFDAFDFSNEEKEEIQKQLDNMIDFFKKNRLVEFYC